MGIKGLGERFLYFDGAMGTVLQNSGLQLGDIPELFNFTHEALIQGVHEAYLEAGADFITTNTFGANRYKMEETAYTVSEVITQAISIAKVAKEKVGKGIVVLDIGPTGKMLKPLGDVSFEEAYEVFKEQVVAGEKAGCEAILFETFTDLYELKAGVLAAKENTSLPIFCTMSFEMNGRTFFGASLETMVLTLEGLGVTMLGINCSLGPKELVPVVEELMTLASVPVLIQPNAGLPTLVDGKTTFNITSDEFAGYMEHFAKCGVSVLGGCCGTTATYIEKVKSKVDCLTYTRTELKPLRGVCSATHAVTFDDVTLIGERLNPTGKKLLKEALKRGDMDFVLKEAIAQKEEGAHILDVNMGLPDIDEVKRLTEAVQAIQSVVDLPLQIDSSNVDAIEAAVRIYNGKPLINSVNGKQSSLDAILPIAKKYGAAVLGLTLNDGGIPETAEERLEVATRIVNEAMKYGIKKEDILIDCLVLTASAQQELVMETLKAVKLVKETLGVKTVLGVSNVSFGLPNRPLLNKTMLTMALLQGLDAPIMNTNSKEMMDAVDAYRVIAGIDKTSKTYIERHGQLNGQASPSVSSTEKSDMTVREAIIKGLRDEAYHCAKEALQSRTPLEIIEEEVVPALNHVGDGYEKQTLFLPQLIQSAEAAKGAFEVIKEVLSTKGQDVVSGPKVVIATVQGDIHDIGKNIVKVIMENYGFSMVDLGKDVAPEAVVEAVTKHNAQMVGLSALMTTTVKSMKETIVCIKEAHPQCQVIVGGAVLTPDLATYVGADFYAKDAMETVRIAQNYFGL
ncbi:MAG: homocysteine S-methyltransferase family protein [Cellulosilyticaceae bacterium]